MRREIQHLGQMRFYVSKEFIKFNYDTYNYQKQSCGRNNHFRAKSAPAGVKHNLWAVLGDRREIKKRETETVDC